MKCFYYSNVKCPYTRMYDKFVDDVPCNRCNIEFDKPYKMPWWLTLVIVIIVTILGIIAGGIGVILLEYFTNPYNSTWQS